MGVHDMWSPPDQKFTAGAVKTRSERPKLQGQFQPVCHYQLQASMITYNLLISLHSCWIPTSMKLSLEPYEIGEGADVGAEVLPGSTAPPQVSREGGLSPTFGAGNFRNFLFMTRSIL